MATIEEKRLALEMADKIIQTRLSRPTSNIKNNARAGEIEYWTEVYHACLEQIKNKPNTTELLD